MYDVVLISALCITLTWEVLKARRNMPPNQAQRWFVNFILMVVNLFLVVALGTIATWALCVLALDLGNYGQHYLLHRVPILRKIHRAHHTDPGCDATTSFRFHPLEVMVGIGAEALVIVLMGAPPIVVATYRMIRVAISTFVHGNVALPAWLDRALRYVLVTPDVHSIHHSIDETEQNVNLSGGLIWWDYLFRTYRAQPVAGFTEMKIGVNAYDDKRAASLPGLLIDPFVRE